jgi:hypothetical protein
MEKFKEHDLVVLPTSKKNWITQYLYITSDEEIEYGDWFVTGMPTVGESIHKCLGKSGDFIIVDLLPRLKHVGFYLQT